MDCPSRMKADSRWLSGGAPKTAARPCQPRGPPPPRCAEESEAFGGEPRRLRSNRAHERSEVAARRRADAPARKGPEREEDAPEANLPIGERRGRERNGPFRPERTVGAKSRAVGAGAFGRSGGVRACRRAARPAWGAPRIRRMRAIRPRRNTAFAAWPRPGGADGRPAVREALGRASAPVPPLRAEGTTFGFPYGASLALAPTLRRRSAAGSRRIEDNPPYHGRARYP